MPIKSLVHSNETKTLNVQMTQQHSFINARNRLVGAAKQHVKKNGLAKNNILGAISQNKFISQRQSQYKIKDFFIKNTTQNNIKQGNSNQIKTIFSKNMSFNKKINVTPKTRPKPNTRINNSNKNNLKILNISNIININKEKDGSLIKNIKTLQSVLNLYKKNRLPYYINSFAEFYKVYPDFDLNYYKKKYYPNTTLTDYAIIYDFHKNDNYKQRLYNDKIKIIIYTPQLYEKCGGITALHLLAKKINTLNHKNVYAKLYCYDGSKYLNNYCNDFANPYEINEHTIVIYPEIISGNPLNAKHVIRWILLELDVEMGKTHYLNWNKTDLVYHWEPNTTKPITQLAVPFLDTQFRNYNTNPRTKTCYLIKKGYLIHDKKFINKMHPADAVRIDNMSLPEIVKTFNESHTFYCYDPNSFYLLSATVCGCITIIHPLKNITKDTYFKNRIMYIDNFLYDSGIAYGNSADEITHARSTIKDAPHNINIMLTKYELNVNKFADDMYDYVIKGKRLTTVQNEYYLQ